jgi:molecular chaperone GrpE (heat shock protein)
MIEGGKLIEDGKMIESGKKQVQQADWKGMPEMDLSEAALTNVHALQHALQQQIAETKAWKDRYQYLRSDLEKTRTRLERFAKRRIRREKDKVLMEFLPLVDDLERQVFKHTAEGEQVKDCLVLALSELQEKTALKK